jgi:hypothetical protein
MKRLACRPRLEQLRLYWHGGGGNQYWCAERLLEVQAKRRGHEPDEPSGKDRLPKAPCLDGDQKRGYQGGDDSALVLVNAKAKKDEDCRKVKRHGEIERYLQGLWWRELWSNGESRRCRREVVDSLDRKRKKDEEDPS